MLKGTCQRIVSNSLGYRSLLFSYQSIGEPWAGNLQRQQFSTDTGFDHEVDLINEKFAEAREEIEFAREDAETVYFNESADVARKAVGGVLEKWQNLLQQASEDDRAKLQRAMGLKIEQLKAELKELEELHA